MPKKAKFRLVIEIECGSKLQEDLMEEYLPAMGGAILLGHRKSHKANVGSWRFERDGIKVIDSIEAAKNVL